MIEKLSDTVTLNNGSKIPGLGLGVFQIPEACLLYTSPLH
ncbi:hypothetical protein A5876_000947 [Enterococcus sp. 3C8_DIV0646]|nr:hypothetical protein A5876_000947 [Enterococcus sp. 3C8_DIV0646]